MGRQVIVVDVETTGLDPARHTLVEVAWVNLATSEEGSFVPPHNVNEVLSKAEVKALQVNRYIDRLAEAPRDDGFKERNRLWNLIQGNTLAGSNPGFDAAFLNTIAGGAHSPWHHRLLDLSAYVAGVLGISPTELPGLATVCELLGVVNEAPHTALGDARATAESFRKLMSRRAQS